MKSAKLLSYALRAACMASVMIPLGFDFSSATYCDEANQGRAPQANGSGISGPLKTIIPKPVESILVDGVTYDIEAAREALLRALSSDSDGRKREFLSKMKGFRQKLQGDLILRLESEFPKQPNPEVRGEILELVMFSHDPRMKEFCDLGKEDQDVKIRAFAAAWLIDNGHLEGLPVLTEALPALDTDRRLKFGAVLFDGINRMQIPFTNSNGVLRPKPRSKEEAMAFLDEWSQWWKQHGAEVLNGSKDSAAQPSK